MFLGSFDLNFQLIETQHYITAYKKLQKNVHQHLKLLRNLKIKNLKAENKTL